MCLWRSIFSNKNAYYAAIASISGRTPKIEMRRFMLYDSTCRLISVLTRSKVRVWKWVYPIHDLIVP